MHLFNSMEEKNSTYQFYTVYHPVVFEIVSLRIKIGYFYYLDVYTTMKQVKEGNKTLQEKMCVFHRLREKMVREMATMILHSVLFSRENKVFFNICLFLVAVYFLCSFTLSPRFFSPRENLLNRSQ